MENGQQSTPSDSKSSPASIAGATVGSLALFSIIVFIIWWFRKGRRRVTKASKGTMVDLSAPSRPRQSQNGFTQQAPSTPPRKGHPLTELLRSVLTQKSQKKSNILAPLTGLSSPHTCPSPHDTEHQDALGRLPTLSHYSAHTGRHHTRSVGQSTSHRSGSSGPPDPRPPGHRTPYLHPILQHQRGHSVDTFTATGSQTGYGTWTGTDGDYTEPWLGTEGGTDAGDQTSLRDTKVIGSTSAHPNLRVSMSSNSHPASPPGLGFPSAGQDTSPGAENSQEGRIASPSPNVPNQYADQLCAPQTHPTPLRNSNAQKSSDVPTRITSVDGHSTIPMKIHHGSMVDVLAKAKPFFNEENADSGTPVPPALLPRVHMLPPTESRPAISP